MGTDVGFFGERFQVEGPLEDAQEQPVVARLQRPRRPSAAVGGAAPARRAQLRRTSLDFPLQNLPIKATNNKHPSFNGFVKNKKNNSYLELKKKGNHWFKSFVAVRARKEPKMAKPTSFLKKKNSVKLGKLEMRHA